MNRNFRPRALALQRCGSRTAAARDSFRLGTGRCGQSSVTAVARQIGVPMEGKFKIRCDGRFRSRQAGQLVGQDGDRRRQLRDRRCRDHQELKGATGSTPPSIRRPSSSPPASGRCRRQVRRGRQLTIKGKTVDIVVPASYRQEGGVQAFDGVLPIKRNAFNIGDGEWKDTSVVADEVQSKFHIVTPARKQG